MANSSLLNLDGPRGPKPRKMLSRRNIILYGTLLVVAVYYLIPLYVMLVTSVKGMPEIRLGNIFSPPVEVTFEPWVKAWAQACTGLNCDGLSRGFWNSVKITIPSVFISIAIASINGYALANWRFKGANLFFTVLIFGAFIPYQIMIYPLVIILRDLGLYTKLPGLIIIHSIFGMPILNVDKSRTVIINKRRHYDDKNVDLLKKIKFLLKEKGMTISGVKKQLNEDFFDIDANENKTINTLDLKYKLNKINKLIKDLKNSNGKKNPR